MSDIDITWEEPPMNRRGRAGGWWAQRLAPLRERPGEWANLGRHAAGTATHITRGRVAGITPGEFDATSRDTTNGKATLYVRFVGGGDD